MSDRHTFERVYVDHYDAVLRYCLRRSDNRLVVINRRASALATVSRFGAIDLATGEWTQLLAPSDH